LGLGMMGPRDLKQGHQRPSAQYGRCLTLIPKKEKRMQPLLQKEERAVEKAAPPPYVLKAQAQEIRGHIRDLVGGSLDFIHGSMAN